MQELNVVSNAVHYYWRWLLRLAPLPLHKPEDILWPESFNGTEQNILRQFVRTKLESIYGSLNTQESLIRTNLALRYVLQRERP